MDSSIHSRFDYGLLDSLEWSEKSHSLSSFLDQFSSSLPHVVKVFEGFCGDASSGTIDSGQILILHSLHKETKILAKNAEDTELFIPKDFQVKVEMIPKNAIEESTSVKELLQTFPKYFRALSDIPSHDITSGSMFKIIRQKGFGCFECLQIINDGEEREVRLPFFLKGRFQALQDNREFLIDEVYAEEKDNLEADEPVNIHFVKSCLSGISVPGLNVASLYDLGTVRLVGECEIETVFATVLSCEDGKTLAVFPKDLDITVRSAKTNDQYDRIRHTIKESQIKTLKRIERLNRLSLYQARNPVRQFFQTELEPPALASGKTRTKSATQASTDPTNNKKRSHSTPPPPPPRAPLETKHKEKPKLLSKKAVSVPTARPASVCDQNAATMKDNRSLKRPAYKPPDIPHQPPLPPKERPKHLFKDKEQNLTPGQDQNKTQATAQQGQGSDPESPPIPPPRLRRRQTSIGGRKDDEKPALIDCSYEQMDGFVESIVEYVEMDGSWITQEGSLEEIFGDIIVDADEQDTTATEDKLNRKEEATAEDKRERADSVDYENTKDLKLSHLKKGVSGKTVFQNDADDPRERVNSMDYENTKELKLAHLMKKVSRKTAPENDFNDQRERSDSVDYENTPKVKPPGVIKDGETVVSDELLEGIPRTGSVEYVNTKQLKLVPLGKRGTTLSEDISQEIPRKDSMDYENTKELKLKIPLEKAKQNQTSNTNDLDGKSRHSSDMQDADRNQNGVTETEQASTLARALQLSSSCSNDTKSINTIGTQERSKLETLRGSSYMECKTVAKTEQFLKELRLSAIVPDSDATIKPKGTERESSAEESKHCVSEGIYYTTMARCVADPSYYVTILADNNSSLLGDVYEKMNANENNESPYVPMNASYAEDDSLYENDICGTKGDDSDEMDDYENVDLVCTSRNKNQLAKVSVGKIVDKNYFSDAYEEVDIIQQIESSLDKNPSTDDQGRFYEKMDMPQESDTIPSPRVRVASDSYEEIGLPINSGSHHHDVISRKRPESNSYEDIDFPPNIAHCYLTKTVSNNTSAPPTPPQRRAKNLRKSFAGETKASADSKDQPEVLSSSPKSCDQISKPLEKDFEDLESLHVHIAMKESERQLLFEKALSSKNKNQQPQNSESPEESSETAQQQSCKDKVSTAAVDQVAERYVKSRPPAPPPPRKPANYLEVEATKKLESKPFKQKPPCNYSKIIGQIQPTHSSREDDMEYIDDIELHYFQKEHMEMEKKRKEKRKEKNENAKDSESSNDVKTKETVKDDDKIPSSNVESEASRESEMKSSVASKVENGSKDGLQDSKKPVITKPLPKRPITKKKPLRALSEPIPSKIGALNPFTSLHLSPYFNQPITSPNRSHDLHKPITSCPSSPDVNRPITSQNRSHDLHKPNTSCPSSPDVIRPITSQNLSDPSRDANNPTTTEHQSHAANKPITRHASERPAVAKKPLVAKRSPNPPPKPKRTFATISTLESSKVVQNSLNTQDTSNTAIQDTSCPWNSKSIQTTAPKHSSSEEKASCQRTRPPKPLPRGKSQN